MLSLCEFFTHRVKHKHTMQQVPNQAFSADPRISKEDQAKLVQALTSPEALPYTEAICKEYGATSLVPATQDEFVVLGDLLKNEWGYN